MDVRALSALSDTSVSSIEAFEAGKGGLDISQAIRLARALGVPRASFIDVSTPVADAYLEPAIMLLSRGTSSLSEEERRGLEQALQRARAFLEIIDLTAKPKLADCEDLFITTKPVEAAAFAAGYERARALRRLLAERLPARAAAAEPLRDVRRLIEDHLGILVVDLSFSTPHVDEASCRLGPARVIAVDPSRSEMARRWALAHGLGHQLLDLSEADAIFDALDVGFSMEKPAAEKRADAFAAMFLAPDAAVDAVLDHRPITTLAQARQAVEDCRRRLGLNFVPMARQLQNLKRISADTAEALVVSPSVTPLEGCEQPTKHDGLERTRP